MRYDLFAAYYETADSCKPSFRTTLGVIHPDSLEYFPKQGFTMVSDIQGRKRFEQPIKAEDLQGWTHEDFVPEVLDVLNCGGTFEKIFLEAEEIRDVDSNGVEPKHGIRICNSFAEFTGARPLSRVIFWDNEDPYAVNENTRRFSVPLKKIKDYFSVLTTEEAQKKLLDSSDGQNWTYDQMKGFFEAGIDDAVDLATKVFFGLKDIDGNPQLLHALAVGMRGQNKTEKIIGFLHDVIEDSDVTLEDLSLWGFSDEVIAAVDILTHRRNVPYEEYIKNIIRSGNRYAVNVKLYDLYHNIERGEAGGHEELNAKHKNALEIIKRNLFITPDGIKLVSEIYK